MTQLKQIRDLLSTKEEAFGVYQAPRDFKGKAIKDLRGVWRHLLGRSYRGYGIRYKPMIDKKGHFGSGLLHRVKNWLKKSNLNYSLTDRRIRPIKPTEPLFKFSDACPLSPYPKQKEAALAAAKAGQGIISACTGYGKSFMMALVLEQIQMKTLIVVPNLTLKRQLTENFINYFGSLENVTIENIDSSRLPDLKGYDCLIIDEAHHAAAATYRKLNRTAWKDIFYRFFFTATPFRSRSDEMLLFESIVGQVIYKISYHDAVADDAIVPVEAYYIDLPPIECNTNDWQIVYSQLVVNREDRNTLIGILMARAHRNNCSTLVLVKEIAHGQKLMDLTNICFLKGENDDNTERFESFNKGSFPVMIGTNGVCGEGVDTRPCEYVIIAGLGKSKNQFMQQVGRALRKHPGKNIAKVILFRDPSHRFSLDHFRQQCYYLKHEYGVKPVKLEVS